MKKVAMIVGLAAALGFNNAEAVDWNWKGDVRERWEYQKKPVVSNPDIPSTSRARTRVRLGVYPWINDELSAGVQISSGKDDPLETISRNQNLGSLFQPKSIYLNEEFIDYHPTFLDNKVNLILGKRDDSNTIIRVDNLVYDSDLTFEGATLQYGKDSDGKEKDGPIAIAGYYLLNSWSSAAYHDPVLYVVQGAYKGEINDLSYLVGAGFNYYENLNTLQVTGDLSAIGTATNSNYNKTPTVTPFANSAYKIVELFGKIGGQVTEKLPWKVYGQYAFNTANAQSINENRRKAWLAGVTIGDAKQVGDWALDFKYDRIERDSVFPLFTDSDRKVGSATLPATAIVNIKGYEIAANYHLVQNFTLGARYFNYNNIDKLASNQKLNQLQLDALVKF